MKCQVLFSLKNDIVSYCSLAWLFELHINAKMMATHHLSDKFSEFITDGYFFFSTWCPPEFVTLYDKGLKD